MPWSREDLPFWLTLDGLLYAVFLVLGHVVGYYVVVLCRGRGYHDFVAVSLGCLGLCLFGVADVVFGVSYVHAAGFGVLMATLVTLASNLGKS